MRSAISLILLTSLCFGALGQTKSTHIMPPMVPTIIPLPADSNKTSQSTMSSPIVSTTKLEANSTITTKSDKNTTGSFESNTTKIQNNNLLNSQSIIDTNVSKTVLQKNSTEANATETQQFKTTPSMQTKKDREKISININGLEIADFVRMVSNIMEKNILISSSVKGKIEFISVKPIYKDEIYDLLINVLENYGYTIVDSNNGYLNVIKAAEASQMNLPIMQKSELPQMGTEVVNIKNNSADVMLNKIKHLLSKNSKVISSKENNALIVSDYPKNLQTIKKLIESIDTRDLTSTQYNHVVPLKNSDSKLLVTTLNNVISKKVLKPGEPRTSVTNDDQSNSLIITATDEDFKDIQQTIEILDSERQQVYVKAKIVEISENKSTEIGMKYGVTGGLVNSSGLFTLGSKLTGGYMTADKSMLDYMNKTTSKTTIASNGSTITESSLGAIDDAIAGAKSVLALGVSLSFLSENGAANVLSEPSLLCLNNQESSIYVGKTKSINAGTSVTSTGLSQTNFTRQDIGLSLKLKPRVSNDQKVSLNVEAKLEDIEAEGTQGQPTTTKREVKTTTIVQNGESVIIGGLIKDKKDTAVSQLPLLGDIPLLGYLFKNEAKTSDKINLVIVLTPYIVEKSADLSSLRKQLEDLDKLQNEYIQKALNKAGK